MVQRVLAALAFSAVPSAYAWAHSAIVNHTHPHDHATSIWIDVLAFLCLAAVATGLLWRPGVQRVVQRLRRRRG